MNHNKIYFNNADMNNIFKQGLRTVNSNLKGNLNKNEYSINKY
jgi:hypothetical protein